jgi:hypothetical protein
MSRSTLLLNPCAWLFKAKAVDEVDAEREEEEEEEEDEV